MTPQTGVFPRIHTSYNIYELLIHEMTHDTANEGDPGLVPRSAPTRRRSGAAPGTSPKQTSAARGAVPGRARNQLERGRNQLGRGLGRAGTTPGGPGRTLAARRDLGRIRPGRTDTKPPPLPD